MALWLCTLVYFNLQITNLWLYGTPTPWTGTKGYCSPLYLLNQKESTRNSAWLSNWGYTEVFSHQCERPNVLWDQSGKEPKIGSSPRVVEKWMWWRCEEETNSGESNGSFRLMFWTDPNSFFVDWVADFWCYFDISFIINIFTILASKMEVALPHKLLTTQFQML